MLTSFPIQIEYTSKHGNACFNQYTTNKTEMCGEAYCENSFIGFKLHAFIL